MSDSDTQVWDPTAWVQATFSDPVDGTPHPVTVKGYSPVADGRSLVMFAGGHQRWVARAQVKR